MDMNNQKSRKFETWQVVGEQRNYANYPANRLTLRSDNLESDGQQWGSLLELDDKPSSAKKNYKLFQEKNFKENSLPCFASQERPLTQSLIEVEKIEDKDSFIKEFNQREDRLRGRKSNGTSEISSSNQWEIPRKYTEFTHNSNKYKYDAKRVSQQQLNDFTIINIEKQQRRTQADEENTKLIKWQIWIFAMAFIRMMLCSLIQTVNPQVRVTTLTEIKALGYKSFIFGYLLIGNLVDNSFDPKRILVAIQIVMAALCLWNSYGLHVENIPYTQFELHLQPCFGLLIGGIEIITILQLFNWFQQKYIGTVLSIWFLSQPLGFAIQFIRNQNWSQFPVPPLTDPEFQKLTETRLITVGCAFFVFSLIDLLGGFVFYPLQKKITIFSEGSRSANEMRQVVQVKEDPQIQDAYKILFKVSDRDMWKSQAYSVSYSMVYVLPEVKQLLICGCLRVSADHISELLLGGASIQKDFIDVYQFKPYFYGACCALLISGILHDIIFARSAYLLILSINLIQIIVEFTLIFVKKDTYELNPIFLSTYGFVTEFSSFYLKCLIPLIIADKNRKGAFELTMAGTIMGITQLAYYACQGLTLVIAEISKQTFQNNSLDIIIRLSVIILLATSSYFTLSQIKKEWVQLCIKFGCLNEQNLNISYNSKESSFVIPVTPMFVDDDEQFQRKGRTTRNTFSSMGKQSSWLVEDYDKITDFENKTDNKSDLLDLTQ